MINRTPLSLAGKLTVLGLLVAAAGISTLFLTNSVRVPPIPIGPILLTLVAALVAAGPWRWTPAAGAAMCLAILVGAFIGGFLGPELFDRMSNPARIGGFVGTWVQMLGLVTGIIAGAVATVQNYLPRAPITSR